MWEFSSSIDWQMKRSCHRDPTTMSANITLPIKISFKANTICGLVPTGQPNAVHMTWNDFNLKCHIKWDGTIINVHLTQMSFLVIFSHRHCMAYAHKHFALVQLHSLCQAQFCMQPLIFPLFSLSLALIFRISAVYYLTSIECDAKRFKHT